MFRINNKYTKLLWFNLILFWAGFFPSFSQAALVTINYQGLISTGDVIDGPSNGAFEAFIGETVQFSISYQADPLLNPNHDRNGGNKHYHGTYPIDSFQVTLNEHSWTGHYGFIIVNDDSLSPNPFRDEFSMIAHSCNQCVCWPRFRGAATRYDNVWFI